MAPESAGPLTLLCCVKPVEFAVEVALEAAADFFGGAAVGLPAGDVVAGGLVGAGAGDDDGVQGPVELAVPAAAEPVPDGPPGGGGDGGDAGELGEGGLGADPAPVGEGQQDLGGGQVAQAGLGGDQARGQVLHDLRDLGFDLAGLPGQVLDPLPEPGQGLVLDGGQPVRSFGCGQGGAGPGPAAGGQGPRRSGGPAGEGDRGGG